MASPKLNGSAAPSVPNMDELCERIRDKLEVARENYRILHDVAYDRMVSDWSSTSPRVSLGSVSNPTEQLASARGSLRYGCRRTARELRSVLERLERLERLVDELLESGAEPPERPTPILPKTIDLDGRGHELAESQEAQSRRRVRGEGIGV